MIIFNLKTIYMKKQAITLLTIFLSTSIGLAAEETPSEIEMFFKRHYVINETISNTADDILGCVAVSYLNRYGMRQVLVSQSSNCLKTKERMIQTLADHGARLHMEEIYKKNNRAELNILSYLGFVFDQRKVYMNSLMQTDVLRIDVRDIDWEKFRTIREDLIRGIVNEAGESSYPADLQIFVVKSVTGIVLNSAELKDDFRGMLTRAVHYSSHLMSDYANSTSKKKSHSALVITPAFDHRTTYIGNSIYSEKAYRNFKDLVEKGDLQVGEDESVSLRDPLTTKKKRLSLFNALPGFFAAASGKQATNVEEAEDILATTDTTVYPPTPEDLLIEQDWAEFHQKYHPGEEISSVVVLGNNSHLFSQELEPSVEDAEVALGEESEQK